MRIGGEAAAFPADAARAAGRRLRRSRVALRAKVRRLSDARLCERQRAELFSRRNLRYRQFADLSSEISLELNADDAVLDGEIVKLGESGRPVFIDLMRRRGPFQFVAFDVLALNDKDVRKLELADRKKLLRAIVPTQSTTILFAQHVDGRGRDFFNAVCDQGLEGIVAKRKVSRYDPVSRFATWLKIKNRSYSEARDRHELFR
jgi:bifunctional non-homologous end joining protein LigD